MPVLDLPCHGIAECAVRTEGAHTLSDESRVKLSTSGIEIDLCHQGLRKFEHPLLSSGVDIRRWCGDNMKSHHTPSHNSFISLVFFKRPCVETSKYSVGHAGPDEERLLFAVKEGCKVARILQLASIGRRGYFARRNEEGKHSKTFHPIHR